MKNDNTYTVKHFSNNTIDIDIANTFLGCIKMFHIIPESCVKDNKKRYYTANKLVKYGVVVINDDGSLSSIPLTADQFNWLNQLGVSNEQWQKTFHASWEKVQNAPIEDLISEQLLHYFSTYGMEAMGYEAHPYIPTKEVFKDFDILPSFNAFTTIHIVSDIQAQRIIANYLYNVMAPNRNYIEYLASMMRFVIGLNTDEIKSFELKCIRYAQTNTVPYDGQEFLRWVVYKVTGSTLLIKDKSTINALKFSNIPYLPLLEKASIAHLASIFYRYKPLFLAMRSQKECRPYINKIRKLAYTFHKPMDFNNVQNVSNMIIQGNIDMDVIKKANIRQLFKLYNFLTTTIHTMVENEVNKNKVDTYEVYNIRNGKLYVRDRDIQAKKVNFNKYCTAQNIIYNEICQRCRDKYKGKKFFIPENISYPVPVSEKQFIGNLPWGTSITLNPEFPMVSAIYWENLSQKEAKSYPYYDGRVDLDLHMQSVNGAFGWNADYRGNGVLFSGDMTDATNGAVEAFYFDPNKVTDNQAYLLTVNCYTGQDNIPFKLFFTNHYNTEYQEYSSKRESELTKNGIMIDISKAVAPPLELKFHSSNAMSLGLFYKNVFYLYGGDIGSSRVPKRNLYNGFLNGMTSRIRKTFSLEVFLEFCGAQIFSEKTFEGLTTEEKDAIMQDVIDLSPNTLTANTLTDLVDFVDKKEVTL